MDKDKIKELSCGVMDIFQDMMAKEMIYFAPVIYLLEPVPDEKEEEMSTDGEKLFFNPTFLLRTLSG